jgi:hypothetical protein
MPHPPWAPAIVGSGDAQGGAHGIDVLEVSLLPGKGLDSHPRRRGSEAAGGLRRLPEGHPGPDLVGRPRPPVPGGRGSRAQVRGAIGAFGSLRIRRRDERRHRRMPPKSFAGPDPTRVVAPGRPEIASAPAMSLHVQAKRGPCASDPRSSAVSPCSVSRPRQSWARATSRPSRRRTGARSPSRPRWVAARRSGWRYPRPPIAPGGGAPARRTPAAPFRGTGAVPQRPNPP